jgi:hypothetical protein
VASGKVGPPTPQIAHGKVAPTPQEFSDNLDAARKEAQHQNVEDRQQQKVEARQQFSRDLLVMKHDMYDRLYGADRSGSGPSQEIAGRWWDRYERGETKRFESELGAWEMGEQQSFEGRLEAWSMGQRESFSKYESDVLKYKSDVEAYKQAESAVPVFGQNYDIRDMVRWAKTNPTEAYSVAKRQQEPARFGVDYDVRDLVRAAKMGRLPEQQLLPEPVFGKDYNMRDVANWAKRWGQTPEGQAYLVKQQQVPAFGVDYNMKDVAVWAKSQGVLGYDVDPLKGKVVAFQAAPQKAGPSDVSWKIDVKIHEPVTFSNEFSEEKLVPAVFGKDYNMKDLARFAKTLTPSPVFGVDYNMKDVGAWAKKQGPSRFGVDYDMRDVAAWAKQQKTPAFGVDYTMKDVGRWAKSFGESPEGQAYIAANKEQAAYEAKQTASREFYTKIGYPQYGGKYEPFDRSMFPAGYDLNISETAEGLRIEPNIPKSFTEQVAESKGGFFSNWLSGSLGLSKQGNARASREAELFGGMVTVGQANLNPYVAEFIAPFESAGVSLLKLAGVQGLQNAPSTALSSFLGSINYGKQALGMLERASYGGNARALREAELLHELTTPPTLYVSPSPELLGYAVRPDLMLASLLGEAALFYTGTKAIQGVGKLAHGVYGHTIKGSGLEQRLVNWAWKDPALSGFEKAGIEKVPHMDTSYLKGSQFITGYEQNTGLSSGLRGLIRGRLPLSELTVGLPTLPGYVPGAAEEALVKGSVSLGGYDMKWLPRLQAGLEFGDMMASPGAAGFGLTVPAPLAAVGVSNVGRVYAFELMAMPSGFASGFARSTADKWADVGFIDDSGKYDMSMSKGGRYFKESMPSDYLAGFSRNEYPLLEIGKGSLGVREFAGSSEYGFTKSGKSLQDMGLVSLSRETFMPTALTMRLPLSEGQLAERSFLRLSSLPALSLTFGKTAVKSWNMPSVPLPMYMTRNLNLLSKQKQQQYTEETQYLSYPGVDVGYHQILKPSQMFRSDNILQSLQRSRFISDWTQKEQQKPMLGLLGGYSVKPYLEMASLLRLPSMRESLPKLDYGMQSTKSQFLFGLSGFGLDVGASTDSRMIMRSVEAQTQKLYVGQRQLQLQVPKTLVLIKPAAEGGPMPQYSPFEDVGYKKLRKRKARMTKEYGFGKFLRVTPVMTAKQYRKLMLG